MSASQSELCILKTVLGVKELKDSDTQYKNINQKAVSYILLV